jgi:hypothetical protein
MWLCTPLFADSQCDPQTLAVAVLIVFLTVPKRRELCICLLEMLLWLLKHDLKVVALPRLPEYPPPFSDEQKVAPPENGDTDRKTPPAPKKDPKKGGPR